MVIGKSPVNTAVSALKETGISQGQTKHSNKV